ncbi:DUF5063 domain-containing protein [Jiangella ureilytica]|uniref:DUF5063 domain-containing protein n=1 Tax=Jiangella ureilytica TaxID=2530374 RepID=A0A4R4R9X7_9ACTN|nr:DUF5063 domain-containing protein [Jiangella ureilytica]TDC45911.1 DUF5063 domain-containing protein [Jiangella ureilytica]
MSSVVARPADDPAAEYGDFAAEIADQIESFLLAVREIARGNDPGSTLSLLLLEVSQLCLAGGRLGAISDVVPDERFEPDAGPDADVDELRLRIAALLEPVDGYVEVVDPVDPERGATGFRLSDDLASIAQDLLHGLSHYKDGRVIEALWWWQFSYLSSWGSTAGAALRALHSLIAHTRLDHHDEQIEVTQEALLPVEAEL